jgi:hypothetical protein
MKQKIVVLLASLAMMACSEDGTGSKADFEVPGSSEVSHEMIVLGEKMKDPYSLENVEDAVKSLYPTKADRIDIVATDLYVRFLPKDEKEYDSLVSMGLELMDHPMDYKIVKEGDYYQDPEISEDKITWQYAVVRKDFVFPKDIEYEILDQCYLSENDAATRSDGIDWTAVERESYRLTGNEALLLPATKAGTCPSGRITIVDDDANGGKAFGVAGVKVMCNAFVKFSSDYTDRDGYYEIGKSYSSNVRYRLVFQNEKKFTIGFNKILVKASTSTLGKSSADGVSVEVTKDSERKLFSRCVVNNAAYEYYNRCSEDDLDLCLPPANTRFWLFQKLDVSSAVMLQHGAILDNSLISDFLGPYKELVKMFVPDITLGLDGKDDYSSIYRATCHELAHASHFSQVKTDYWDNYIAYIMTSYVTSGGMTYGNGSEPNSGYCEIGEMWAYFMESIMYKDRYGGSAPSFGNSFWFYPQIFRYMNERGMSCSQILKALVGQVHSREMLQDKLCELYPDDKSMIEQVFNRYND